MGANSGVSRRRLLELGGLGAVAVTGAGMGTVLGRSRVTGSGKTVRVNVGVRDGGAAAVEAVAETVHRRYAFDALTATVPADAVEELASRADVRYLERDAELRVEPVETRTAEAPATQITPFGVDRVDADAVDATGAGVDVAVVDSGIDASHPDLRGNVGAGATVVGSYATDADTTAPAGQDDNGHGTHVAGTIAAVDGPAGVVGVAPEVTLHPVKAITASGTGFNADVAYGIQYAADEGWDVVNLSVSTTDETGTRLVNEACDYARGRGTLPVAASGNGGPCADCVTAPGSATASIAVSATNHEDGLADFSSTGPEVDLAAPGDTVLSTHPGGGYVYMSGTSMAAPHVAGAAALLAGKGYGTGAIETELLDSAAAVGLGSDEAGAGLLDVGRAVAGEAGDGYTPHPTGLD